MKTISDHLTARRAERRAELITRAGRTILVVMISGAVALIIGGAITKAARIAADVAADCEVQACAGPEW